MSTALKRDITDDVMTYYVRCLVRHATWNHNSHYSSFLSLKRHNYIFNVYQAVVAFRLDINSVFK